MLGVALHYRTAVCQNVPRRLVVVVVVGAVAGGIGSVVGGAG